ncbi:MAG: ATP-binding protein [Chloroflexota bacterium]
MIVAVASGKGGTGKTTVAASLALSLAAEQTPPPLFLDCDVEAPNAHLFLRPNVQSQQDVNVLIPEVDEARCTHCGKCAQVCPYQAIALLGKKTLVFPQLCHGCGSCTAVCPEHAIHEHPHPIGRIARGPAAAGIEFAHGSLNIGEPMAVPVIRRLKKWARPVPGQLVLIDCPPGAACPVVAALSGADFALLVTEPTPFGLHDLKQAAAIARELGIPAGVVVNRDEGVFPTLDNFCAAAGIPILLRIPFEREIAEGIARGRNLIEIRPAYLPRLRQLFEKVRAV